MSNTSTDISRLKGSDKLTLFGHSMSITVKKILGRKHRYYEALQWFVVFCSEFDQFWVNDGRIISNFGGTTL